ncbi:MAG: hypothetical protein AAGC55_14940, partial [Myxococcota bacterium]
QRLLEQMRDLQPASPPGGSLILESDNIPAEATWQGAEPAAAGDQPAPPAAPPAGQAAPAAGQPTDDGAADGEAKPAAKLELPDGVAAPTIQRLGPLTRDYSNNIGTLGKSTELATALFESLSDGQYGPEVYDIGGDFFIVKLVERKKPDPADFDDKQERTLVNNIAGERRAGAIFDWLRDRCVQAVEAGQVSINQGLLTELSDDPEEPPFTYQPCQILQNR